MNEKTSILVVRTDIRAGDHFKQHIAGDVGLDLEVWFPKNKPESLVIMPFAFAWLPTGLKIKVDENCWGCIRPRSSTFMKRKLFVMEGTIDSGYTGDLFIVAFNPSLTAVTVTNGDRLAQLIPIPKFSIVDIQFVTELPLTMRGNRGFGSTGFGFRSVQ